MEEHPPLPPGAVTNLNITAILRDLEEAGVRYVLIGSVAAAAYGAPVEPRDLDIAPDLDPENLSRLAGVLRRWNAKPLPDPDWPASPTPEECERWTPDPPTAEHLDHLMTTPIGLFDVVPYDTTAVAPGPALPEADRAGRSGLYAELIQRALPLLFAGRDIPVAHPADLIATLRMHKPKHQVRFPRLTAILERLERGESITPALMDRVEFLMRTLGLEPHPEGGVFREVFHSRRTVTLDGRERAALSVIHFLLAAGEKSRWHRVAHDEAWHFYEGAPLELLWVDPELTRLERRVLSEVGMPGEPLAVVPAGSWQAARSTGRYSLVGCTVGPGFEYAEFTLLSERADLAAALRARFPELGSLL